MKKLFAAALAVLFAVSACTERVPPGTDDAVRERLQAVGEVCLEGEDCGQAATTAAAGGDARSGKAIYEQFCFACHQTGASDAPRLNTPADWEGRLEKGEDELFASVKNGLNLMPPQGTCMDCSDEELRDALDYMLENVE